jgi:Fe-S-cluster containining protein
MAQDGAGFSSDVRVTFTVNGRAVHAEARAPDGPVRLDELLPALRAIDDRLIEAAVAHHETAGGRISCRKGCSACCRVQPVPVTPPEAGALARLVDALPEPRRRAVHAAFAAAREGLRTAGLYEVFIRRDPGMTREATIAAARRYMGLGLICPFLVDDTCSIYPDRPFVCRQYFVTSPPELCVAPLDNPVKPVRMPARFATALLKAAEALNGRAQHTVPLVLALDYAEANQDELARTHDGKQAFRQVMDSLRESRAIPTDK